MTTPEDAGSVQVIFRTPNGQEVVTTMGLEQWLAITGAGGKENLPAYLRELLEWDGDYHGAAHRGLVQMVTELRDEHDALGSDLETLWEETHGASLPKLQPGNHGDTFEALMQQKEAQREWGDALRERTKARRAADEARRQQCIANQTQPETISTDDTPPSVL